ncbi:uncharacterized protein [Clytia hemisphaerica]|uniref:VWFA domain-containing protein n=2 Tax=Clytia hemisphaerica TaxID=252671 RepID=A0A7M5TW67_9CNID
MDPSNAHSAVVMSENNAHAPPHDQSNAAAAPVVQELTLSCESEYKDYKYNEKVDIWSLISLKAPAEPEDENEEKRPPVDLVAVIDKSGSMTGQKLNPVKKTLEFVLTQLKDKDRLSVVTYDTQVYLDFPLRKMDKDGKEFAAKKVEAIRDGSTTNLSGGLLKGLCQMIERKEKNEVASVLLFTDGLANAGITNAEGIVAAMKDPTRFSGVAPQPQLQFQQNILPQQPAPHQGWLRNVFGGRGNQNAAPQPQMQVQQMEVDPPASLPPVESSPEKKSTDATVYTFGFGDDHDPNMLTKISDAGNGMYYYIENEDKIAESFAHCLGGLMSTVGQGIQLHVNLEQGVTIKNVHTVKPFQKISDQSVKIDIGRKTRYRSRTNIRCSPSALQFNSTTHFESTSGLFQRVDQPTWIETIRSFSTQARNDRRTRRGACAQRSW